MSKKGKKNSNNRDNEYSMPSQIPYHTKFKKSKFKNVLQYTR